MSDWVRWLKFNLVGVGGVLVQLGVLQVWMHFHPADYLVGTGVAVGGALLHNFAWHCGYTWSDRRTADWPEILGRGFRFLLSNGAVSLGGNLVLMQLLVSVLSLPVLIANIAAIAACSTVNYFLGDRWVFEN